MEALIFEGVYHESIVDSDVVPALVLDFLRLRTTYCRSTSTTTTSTGHRILLVCGCCHWLVGGDWLSASRRRNPRRRCLSIKLFEPVYQPLANPAKMISSSTKPGTTTSCCLISGN
ncbi:hypothetical protein HRR80_008777 [Exophiala dermatitidis]|uniref:Uncharacterized protein n=1 Tax=Exophiala dermatitidis TaxID=5970 RepID=A0AAN6EL12_EXODE|nr:hypothetical protein HRR73_008865 [Exophiala dermatitidis]KAJ4533570.1 hypothetical protein HRR77_008546 [Exophiala dermatitidis]KAJ4540334.1 hypothetical protein HRR76_003737 [Exophiala dermatitidis]KAJ4627117.1 hypothetical protein HRR88_003623 [Exophiala dermatitidis]KAJ4633187.1 hypothetical protein HRR89_008145 [Exophiala dermatitidis]